jgi:hypothetical protein
MDPNVSLLMSALETLFRHEVHFFEQVRESFRTSEALATHTSFALHHGYEELIRASAGTTGREVERLAVRLTFIGDSRDVLAARDSVKSILGISSIDV